MSGTDYQSGYDDALAEAAASVEAMDRKLRDTERLVMAMVKSAGGKLFVSHGSIVDTTHDRFELIQEDNIKDFGWDFRIKIKS